MLNTVASVPFGEMTEIVDGGIKILNEIRVYDFLNAIAHLSLNAVTLGREDDAVEVDVAKRSEIGFVDVAILYHVADKVVAEQVVVVEKCLKVQDEFLLAGHSCGW